MLITKQAFDGAHESRSKRLDVNVWREFSFGGHFLQNAVQEFDEVQKARGDHDQMPIAANPAAFKQEQRPQRTVPFQKSKHHVYDNLQLVSGGRYSLGSQPDGRVDLLPRVLKACFQEANIAFYLLVHLTLSATPSPTTHPHHTTPF